jgi:hypothetical protein
MTNKQYKYLTSRKFIIDFLESIEQPLTENQIHDIMEGSKYLDQLLQEQKIAIDEMLAEEF